MSRFALAILALVSTNTALAATVNLGADAVAWQELFESYNAPANNNYGSPADLVWTYDAANPGATVATATVRCGSYAAKGFVVGAQLTESELTSLTTSPSPEAAKWYDAIVAGASVGAVHIGEVDIADLERGDILAAKYETATDTGHVMIVGSVSLVPTSTPSWVVPLSPTNAGTDARWIVVIHDATKTPHGTTPNSRATDLGVQRDSRNEFTDAGGVEDQGVGVGTVLVYTDSSGAITGWRWSHNGSYYANDTTGRPLVAGRITEDI